MTCIHDNQVAEDKLNSKYSDMLEEWKADICVEDWYCILQFNDWPRLYFETVDGIDKFMRYQYEVFYKYYLEANENNTSSITRR